MSRKLPPLYPLRTFEAAARHLNFTRAAEELSLSQAAISQQVKSLEEFLETALFIRRGRRLELTVDGQSLLPVIRRALDDIAAAIETLAGGAGGATGSALHWRRISRPPGSRLAWRASSRDTPDIELRLIQRIQDVDYAREGVDLSVSLWNGGGIWPEHETEQFLNAPMTPVCSPDLAATFGPNRSPKDLSRFVLLDVPKYNLWGQWIEASGADLDLHSGTIIDDYNVLLRAAVDGQGIALGIRGLIDEYFDSGRLVQLFDGFHETDFAYYLVYPREALRRPEVNAFYDWLRDEAAKS